MQPSSLFAKSAPRDVVSARISSNACPAVRAASAGTRSGCFGRGFQAAALACLSRSKASSARTIASTSEPTAQRSCSGCALAATACGAVLLGAVLRVGGAQRATTGVPAIDKSSQPAELKGTTLDLDGSLKDGDKFLLGTTELLAMHTPGHTQGSSCIWIPGEKTLLAGDTLFRDSIGRTDLPGGDGRQILRSIANKLLPLPEDTLVVCGHGDSTTIGREKKRNPFLRGL